MRGGSSADLLSNYVLCVQRDMNKIVFVVALCSYWISSEEPLVCADSPSCFCATGAFAFGEFSYFFVAPIFRDADLAIKDSIANHFRCFVGLSYHFILLFFSE